MQALHLEKRVFENEKKSYFYQLRILLCASKTSSIYAAAASALPHVFTVSVPIPFMTLMLVVDQIRPMQQINYHLYPTQEIPTESITANKLKKDLRQPLIFQQLALGGTKWENFRILFFCPIRYIGYLPGIGETGWFRLEYWY